MVNGRTPKRVDEAVRRIAAESSNANVSGVAADMGTAEGADLVIARVPHVDVLVNNVGIFEPRDFGEITDADWLRFFGTNRQNAGSQRKCYDKVQYYWKQCDWFCSLSGLPFP